MQEKSEQSSKQPSAFIIVTEQAVDHNDKYYKPYEVGAVILISAIAVSDTFILTLLLAAFHPSEIVTHKIPPFFHTMPEVLKMLFFLFL